MLRNEAKLEASSKKSTEDEQATAETVAGEEEWRILEMKEESAASNDNNQFGCTAISYCQVLVSASA